MVYLIAALFFVFCLVAIIIGIRVYKENCKVAAQQKKMLGEDNSSSDSNPLQ